MRAPIAEKLAELRKAIARIEATPRKGFTKKQRQAVWDKYEGHCAGCDDPLQPGWHIDHITALADGGAHALTNWRAFCVPCHQDKSATETTARAKTNRIRRREDEGPRPAQIRSRNQWPTGQKLQSRNTFARRPA